jgi:hypothetical protein
MRNGGPTQAVLTGEAFREYPFVVSAINEITALAYRPLSVQPMGLVELTTLHPGTQSVPYCSPTNHRLRLQLAIFTPGVTAV